MPEIAAFPHLSLSAAQTLATQRCGFLPVWRSLPSFVFLWTLLFTGCVISCHLAPTAPPPPAPHSSAYAQLPACYTRNSLKKLVSYLSDLYSW